MRLVFAAIAADDLALTTSTRQERRKDHCYGQHTTQFPARGRHWFGLCRARPPIVSLLRLKRRREVQSRRYRLEFETHCEDRIGRAREENRIRWRANQHRQTDAIER